MASLSRSARQETVVGRLRSYTIDIVDQEGCRERTKRAKEQDRERDRYVALESSIIVHDVVRSLVDSITHSRSLARDSNETLLSKFNYDVERRATRPQARTQEHEESEEERVSALEHY